MAKEHNQNLLIVAIVGVVAIVALLVFSSRPSTPAGMALTEPYPTTPEGGEGPGYMSCCCGSGTIRVPAGTACTDFCGDHGGGGYCDNVPAPSDALSRRFG